MTKCNEYDFNRIIYSIYKGRIDIKNDFLSKYNLNIKIDDIQNIIIEHFKTIKDEEIDIDILFPFLNILLKNDFFGKKVNVRIRISTYDEKEIINKINELKEQGVDVNFPSLKLLLDEHENLKKFPINYNQVKKLELFETFYNSEFDYDNIIYKKLFCDFNKDYLINLTIIRHFQKIRTEILINYINDFKLLEYLKLINFVFEKENVLKLYNLKTLIIEKCDNISFEENSLINLKHLSIHNCTIDNPNKRLFKFPNLEKCSLQWIRSNFIHDGECYSKEDISYLEYFNSFIDFNSIKNLSEFEGDFSQFLSLINCNFKLKKLKLTQLSHDKGCLFMVLFNIDDFNHLMEDEEGARFFSKCIQNEKNVIEKICNSTELKEVEFETLFIEKEDLLKFNINNSVQKLSINYIHSGNIYNNIIEKFPNVSELFIKVFCGLNGKGVIIEENANNKINKINIIIQAGAFLRGINITCGPFEKLESFSLTLEENKRTNLINSFPIFYDKCPVIFKNLKFFSFKVNGYQDEFNNDIIKNMFNNIDNMPNLESFLFEYENRKSNLDYYNEDVIKKLLGLKLINSIFVIIYNKEDSYSKNELKSIYPGINFNKFKKIKLPKV